MNEDFKKLKSQYSVSAIRYRVMDQHIGMVEMEIVAILCECN